MIVKKIHFTFDKTAKAEAYQKVLLRKYKNYSPRKSNVIIVIGGDGFMLETLKKYKKYKKPFYGMNRGSFGFLMNKFKTKKYKKTHFKSQAGNYFSIGDACYYEKQCKKISNSNK